MGRIAERTNYVSDVVAFIKTAQLCRRKTYLLHNNGYRAALNVCISNGQRHPLAILTNTYNDEIACLATLCYQWGFNLKKINLL